MVDYININDLESALSVFDRKINEFEKKAFTPGQAPPPPMTAQQGPPMDPNAMPPQGAPMDPNAMPPQGAPMDPNAMPPQGGISPELQQMLTQLADGMGEVATTSAEQQTAIDQLAKQQLSIEQQLQEIRNMLSDPLPTDSSAVDSAPAQQGGSAVEALGQMQ
jgi:hypothetical protein